MCPLLACVHLPSLLNSASRLAYLREEETRFVNLEKLLKKKVEDSGKRHCSGEVMN